MLFYATFSWNLSRFCCHTVTNNGYSYSTATHSFLTGISDHIRTELVWEPVHVLSTACSKWTPTKSGGQAPYVDPVPENGGQLTPWTLWLLGPRVCDMFRLFNSSSVMIRTTLFGSDVNRTKISSEDQDQNSRARPRWDRQRRPTPLSLYHNCDSTTIRLRYDNTTTNSTTTEVIEITICVRFDYDTTTTRLRRKINMFIFCSRRIVSNGSRRAIRRSRIVVVSQSSRTHIVISITSVVVECVVVSSYRSRIAIVI